MAEIGTVLAASVGPNKDQTTPVRLVKCTMSSDDDIQTIQLAGSLDVAPVANTQLLIFDVGQAYKIGFVLNDFVLPAAVIGEQWIYAALAGATLSSVKCKIDATTVINDGVDFAVAYTRMKTAFDTLKAEITANHNLIATSINQIATYINAIAPGTVTPYVPSTLSADMSSATSPTVKIP